MLLVLFLWLPSQALGQEAEGGEGRGSLSVSQEILFVAPAGRGKRECVETLGTSWEAGPPCPDVRFVYCTKATGLEAV